MQEARLKILRELVIEEPNDPFNHYALAIELLKGSPTESKEILSQLSNTHPDYLPTYYQLGSLFTEEDEYELAIETFEKGILVAETQDNQKIKKELIGALKMAKDEAEEW
ncbi:tetratricopeptide repeat protein [Jiulongibacter sp. NS-SX5]|uniref:tetratricopeptide repeat protein n=1 Tax=Jiulongibacter sp. NS-SX5 TaxID=3463854 RepID=UPI004059A335